MPGRRKQMLYFTDYGKLAYLDAAEYYAGDWRYVGFAKGDDGNTYDLVRENGGNEEMRYSIIGVLL